MLAVGLVLIFCASLPITTIVSRDFFGTTTLAVEILVVFFLHLQTGQINTDPSFVRRKTILFSHVGQNSIAVSSLNRVNFGETIQY